MCRMCEECESVVRWFVAVGITLCFTLDLPVSCRPEPHVFVSNASSRSQPLYLVLRWRDASIWPERRIFYLLFTWPWRPHMDLLVWNTGTDLTFPISIFIVTLAHQAVCTENYLHLQITVINCDKQANIMYLLPSTHTGIHINLLDSESSHSHMDLTQKCLHE